jgi:hypothetical protein
MTSLEELHWHNANCTEENMLALSSAIMPRWDKIKVFSIPMADRFDPQVIIN